VQGNDETYHYEPHVITKNDKWASNCVKVNKIMFLFIAMTEE